MEPFDYPVASHQRRHGPRGYSQPESYRPWLRDEFSFRCVYCLSKRAAAMADPSKRLPVRVGSSSASGTGPGAAFAHSAILTRCVSEDNSKPSPRLRFGLV